MKKEKIAESWNNVETWKVGLGPMDIKFRLAEMHGGMGQWGAQGRGDTLSLDRPVGMTLYT